MSIEANRPAIATQRAMLEAARDNMLAKGYEAEINAWAAEAAPIIAGGADVKKIREMAAGYRKAAEALERKIMALPQAESPAQGPGDGESSV